MPPAGGQNIRFSLAGVGVVVVALACSEQPSASSPPIAGGREAGGAIEPPPSTLDGSMPDMAIAPPVDGSPTDGAQAPVRVGVIPTPRPDEPLLGVSLGDIDTLAAGSRGITLVLRYDEHFTAASTPNASAWQDIETRANLYRDAGVEVLVAIGVVERAEDARPPGLTAWDSAEAFFGVEAFIDRVFAVFGDELAYVSLGTELDRWIVGQTSTERDAFIRFVGHAFDYAARHPARRPGTAMGATVSHHGLVAPDPHTQQIIDRAEALIATYYPLDDDFIARAPETIGEDIDALSSAAQTDAGARQLILQEVGYPSARDAGSSVDQQAAFYRTLFDELSEQRHRFPFVALFSLYELPVEACEADAASYGAADATGAIAARCSLGLRRRDREPKPAWGVALDGLARFASP